MTQCRFGRFTFDVDTLDLRRDGIAVALQRQPKQLLACLVRNAGRTVARDELRQAVWGSDTFVDFDRGLNFCMSQIRSAIGDDATRPTYVRTVARQGYEFIAPVEWMTPAVEPKRFRRSLLITGAAIVLSCAGVISALVLQGREPKKDVPIVAVLRFDNETGNPALSRFSDDLTDTFVERLTSDSRDRYAVIGNAEILRRPRERRDLRAIAASLHANFVILGQVQAFGAQTRILVHLIHMPEQTHVSVARMDRQLANPLALEDEAAGRIAAKFSQKLFLSTGVTR